MKEWSAKGNRRVEMRTEQQDKEWRISEFDEEFERESEKERTKGNETMTGFGGESGLNEKEDVAREFDIKSHYASIGCVKTHS
jgi:hypothetical protein